VQEIHQYVSRFRQILTGWQLDLSVQAGADIEGLIGCLYLCYACFPSSRISQCPSCHNMEYVSAMKMDYRKEAYDWEEHEREREHTIAQTLGRLVSTTKKEGNCDVNCELISQLWEKSTNCKNFYLSQFWLWSIKIIYHHNC